MKAIELTSVSKEFQAVNALKNLDLSINRGEVLGLFGHNGAGKTTTIKMILGLIKPSAGTVRVFGEDPAGAKACNLRNKIGFLQENVSFYENMTGMEVLNYFAKLKGVSPGQPHRLFEQLGLDHAAHRRVKTYSKGMCQRLGLAQAMLGEPKLLLLDEPTVGLDPLATRDFYNTLMALKASGCTILLCSHLLSGIEKIIDRALILKQGEAIAVGDIEQLRQEANLPVNIVLYGKGLQLPTHLNIHHNLLEKGIDCTVSQQQYMSILQEVMTLPGLNRVEVNMPSLDELYAHFNHEDEVKGKVYG